MGTAAHPGDLGSKVRVFRWISQELYKLSDLDFCLCHACHVREFHTALPWALDDSGSRSAHVGLCTAGREKVQRQVEGLTKGLRLAPFPPRPAEPPRGNKK